MIASNTLLQNTHETKTPATEHHDKLVEYKKKTTKHRADDTKTLPGLTLLLLTDQ